MPLLLSTAYKKVGIIDNCVKQFKKKLCDNKGLMKCTPIIYYEDNFYFCNMLSTI
jgi:hypothetical protein